MSYYKRVAKINFFLILTLFLLMPFFLKAEEVSAPDDGFSLFGSEVASFLDGLIFENNNSEKDSVKGGQKTENTSLTEGEILEPDNSNDPGIKGSFGLAIGNLVEKIRTLTLNSLTALSSFFVDDNLNSDLAREKEETEEFQWQIISTGSCSSVFEGPGVQEGKKCQSFMSKAKVNVWHTERCNDMWELKEVVCR